MVVKKHKYVVQHFVGILIGLFSAAFLYSALVLLLTPYTFLVRIISMIYLTLLGVGIWYVIRLYSRHFLQSEQIMRLYAMGYTIEDICQLEWYASRGTEMALTKAMELLDTGKLLSVSKRQAQYLALQNQINPHFLYNTLEGIRSEAVIAGLDVVADMTESLAKFFRYTISKVENLVAVSDEIENVQTYFAIQQFRFGERLHLTIDYTDDPNNILECYLPKLTLQPIVENAILHGLEQKIGDGHLRITLSCTEKRLIIQVSDDGVGMEKDKLKALQEALEKTTYEYIDGRKEGGIALLNVNNRIRLLFGEAYGVVINSVEGLGTDVVVNLPVDMEGKQQKRCTNET